MKKNTNLVLTLTLFGLLFFIPVSDAQEHPNSLYFEALGNCALYSFNYDRMFSENFGGRIGVMYLSNLDLLFVSAKDLVLVPFTLNYLTGGRHKFEAGLGIVFASVSGTGAFGFDSGPGTSNVVGTATLGYRYQKPQGGFLFRAGFTPLFNSEGFEPWFGISIGFSF